MWDLWDNKHADLCIKISEERVRGIKKGFKEIMAENFWNLKRETDIQVQEAQSLKQDEPKIGLHQDIL